MFRRDPTSRLLAIGPLLAGLCRLEAVALGCAALSELPATLGIRARKRQQLQLPVTATRLTVGNPGVAEGRLLNRDSVLLVGKGPGMTNVSVWIRCSKEPHHAEVVIAGEATAALTSPVPGLDSSLPSQVQTDIRFVEVKRSRLKEVGMRIFGTQSNN